MGIRKDFWIIYDDREMRFYSVYDRSSVGRIIGLSVGGAYNLIDRNDIPFRYKNFIIGKARCPMSNRGGLKNFKGRKSSGFGLTKTNK